jgi:hypothetical protein
MSLDFEEYMYCTETIGNEPPLPATLAVEDIGCGFYDQRKKRPLVGATEPGVIGLVVVTALDCNHTVSTGRNPRIVTPGRFENFGLTAVTEPHLAPLRGPHILLSQMQRGHFQNGHGICGYNGRSNDRLA